MNSHTPAGLAQGCGAGTRLKRSKGRMIVRLWILLPWDNSPCFDKLPCTYVQYDFLIMLNIFLKTSNINQQIQYHVVFSLLLSGVELDEAAQAPRTDPVLTSGLRPCVFHGQKFYRSPQLLQQNI
jgi:hypothetical protein